MDLREAEVCFEGVNFYPRFFPSYNHDRLFVVYVIIMKQ